MRKGVICTLLAVTFSMPSCTGWIDVQLKGADENRNARESLQSVFTEYVLTDFSDSLSYSVGVVFSSEMYATMQERGIGPEQAYYFVKGLRDASIIDDSPETSAYANGVRLGADIAAYVEYEEEFNGLEMSRIDRTSFRKALLEMAGGGLDSDAVVQAKRSIGSSSDASVLSYAAGVLLFKEYSGYGYGIVQENIGDFVRGVGDAFSLSADKQASAYVSGVGAALDAETMLEKYKELILAVPGAQLRRRAYIEAVAASASGMNGKKEVDAAQNYFDWAIYRMPAEKFLADNRNRHGVKELPSGLQYKVLELGKGDIAGEDDTVKCIYKCTMTDGYILDTTKGKSDDLKLSEQLPGFKEALMTLPAGTKCMLYLPWQLAYGTDGQGVVPPYTVLVYDLEILGKE